ncbi:uncharacterized protein Z518_04374 [Rhinocladiella mackenziei CBS 650.93]|uniref:Uncharacterized protein n=1 Tax=Rhinocladiella mackenziei CBS 650.93 TaxID=1442369 RepID=A0A0D2H7M7_9EURO|nr:uncharacterized protein Z518_04374 [Rhinocladiella mackenziei CBS 650.93]KIX06398.1 hypothetical protein Z518_04374 [Rhinocladiella mackenziei CBS 650.93]
MHWIDNFGDLQLDIVGIIAVLGEGSVTRNAQVTSLSWWSTIPRLLPAPQALLEHERKYRLPTAPGIVAGAYSGLVKREINFFAQLLHDQPLDDYQVELVQVTRKCVKEGERSFGPRKYGPLFWVSILGSLMALTLIGLSAHYHDGFSLLATIMLSMVSSFVGFGTHWTLVFKEPTISRERKAAIPRSDVIIYYPNGSIRIIRPESEQIARLYFQTEHAQYIIDGAATCGEETDEMRLMGFTDTPYRTLALLSTVMLMTGVVSLANSSNILQVAFAASYLLLNGIYWAVSALNPCKYHWQHAYKVEILPIEPLPSHKTDPPAPTGKIEEFKGIVKREWQRFESAWILSKRRDRAEKRAKTMVAAEARNFTGALWTAIVFTGTSQWLNEATTIAPMNDAWREWLREAEKQVRPKLEEGEIQGGHNDNWTGRHNLHRRPRINTGTDWNFTPATMENADLASEKRRIRIHAWPYQEELTRILQRHAAKTRVPIGDEVVGGDERRLGSEKDPSTPGTALEV